MAQNSKYIGGFGVASVVVVTFLIFTTHNSRVSLVKSGSFTLLNSSFSDFGLFHGFSAADQIQTVCVPQKIDGESLSIGEFSKLLTLWSVKTPGCREALHALHSIYRVGWSHGEIAVDTDLYKSKIMKWLGNDESLYKQALNQSTLSLFNKYTREQVIFNPLRAKRPTSQLTSDLEYIEKLHNETKDECDFCNYKIYTARDLSGRLENDLAFAAANTFRYDRKHQLILPRSHHPLNWSKEEFLAMFQLAQKWFNQEYQKEPMYSYPVIMWDLLPHGGASQIHPHLQIVLQPHSYPAGVEAWMMGAREYYKDIGRNYFSDLILLHDSLGLTVRYKTAVALATLMPKKDNEIVIFCQEASTDFYELLYFVIRAFIEDKKVYPFSLVSTLPPLQESSKSVPALTRIVTRGHASEVRSDISALELFTFYNVNSDPFKLIKEIQKSVDKRGS